MVRQRLDRKTFSGGYNKNALLRPDTDTVRLGVLLLEMERSIGPQTSKANSTLKWVETNNVEENLSADFRAM